MRCHAGVVAARHHHHIVVLDHAGLVEAAVVGVDPLEGEALRRVEPVVVGFFQQRLLRRHVAVVLVRGIAARMATRRDDLGHQQVIGGRVVGHQHVADMAGVAALAAHAAAHGAAVDAAHRLAALVRGGAQRHFRRAARGDEHRLAAGHIERVGRLLLEDALARAQTGVRRAADLNVDRAGQHDQAEFARAGLERFALAGLQAQGPEADVRPASRFRRDVADLAAGGGLDQQGGLGHVGSWRLSGQTALASMRSTMARSVS